MKKYVLELDVPDDFNPESMGINIDYSEDLAITDEYFKNDDSTLNEIQQIVDKLIVSNLGDVNNSNVILFKFSPELMNSDPETIVAIQKMLEIKLGCTVIGLVNDVDILIQNSVEAIKMLQRMIDKINSKAIIKLS